MNNISQSDLMLGSYEEFSLDVIAFNNLESEINE